MPDFTLDLEKPCPICFLGICQDGGQKTYNVTISGESCGSDGCRTLAQYTKALNFTVNMDLRQEFFNASSEDGGHHFGGILTYFDANKKTFGGSWTIRSCASECGADSCTDSTGSYIGTEIGNIVELDLTGSWGWYNKSTCTLFSNPFNGKATFTISQ